MEIQQHARVNGCKEEFLYIAQPTARLTNIEEESK